MLILSEIQSDAWRPITEDPVANVLKWILLAVVIATFSLLGWTK
jgi:hypothetical protein